MCFSLKVKCEFFKKLFAVGNTSIAIIYYKYINNINVKISVKCCVYIQLHLGCMQYKEKLIHALEKGYASFYALLQTDSSGASYGRTRLSRIACRMPKSQATQLHFKL